MVNGIGLRISSMVGVIYSEWKRALNDGRLGISLFAQHREAPRVHRDAKKIRRSLRFGR